MYVLCAFTCMLSSKIFSNPLGTLLNCELVAICMTVNNMNVVYNDRTGGDIMHGVRKIFPIYNRGDILHEVCKIFLIL